MQAKAKKASRLSRKGTFCLDKTLSGTQMEGHDSRPTSGSSRRSSDEATTATTDKSAKAKTNVRKVANTITALSKVKKEQEATPSTDKTLKRHASSTNGLTRQPTGPPVPMKGVMP